MRTIHSNIVNAVAIAKLNEKFSLTPSRQISDRDFATIQRQKVVHANPEPEADEEGEE